MTDDLWRTLILALALLTALALALGGQWVAAAIVLHAAIVARVGFVLADAIADHQPSAELHVHPRAAGALEHYGPGGR